MFSQTRSQKKHYPFSLLCNLFNFPMNFVLFPLLYVSKLGFLVSLSDSYFIISSVTLMYCKIIFNLVRQTTACLEEL